MSRPGRRLPAQLYTGLVLVAAFWPLNWAVPGLRTHLLFFPLWLGYCLTVDGLVALRTGGSALTRNPLGFAALFLVSVPGWWLFEVVNWRTDNWRYLGGEAFGPLEYFLLASLSFSTVMPAVFGTAEVMASTAWIDRLRSGPRLPAGVASPTRWLVTGLVMFALVMAWPDLFFALVWTSLFFVLEPINAWLGRPTMMAALRRGDWRAVAALAAGALVCGFFWEMWNYLSFPKWVYRVPYVDFARVFEMPLLGYGGYLPFSLELFALYHLVVAVTGTGLLFRPHPGGGAVELPGVECADNEP